MYVQYEYIDNNYIYIYVYFFQKNIYASTINTNDVKYDKKGCGVCRPLFGDIKLPSKKDLLSLPDVEQNINTIENVNLLLNETPPDYWELGQSTWTYLHTMAAYYPNNPTEDQKNSMPQFLQTFARIYPCEECSEHMIQYLRENPPLVSNNHELSLWLCKLHNDINIKLGKEAVPCDVEYVLCLC